MSTIIRRKESDLLNTNEVSGINLLRKNGDKFFNGRTTAVAIIISILLSVLLSGKSGVGVEKRKVFLSTRVAEEVTQFNEDGGGSSLILEVEIDSPWRREVGPILELVGVCDGADGAHLIAGHERVVSFNELVPAYIWDILTVEVVLFKFQKDEGE